MTIANFVDKLLSGIIHVLSHSRYADEIRAGCVCAERMTDDYVTHRKRERQLLLKSKRRETFLEMKGWKVSRKGNLFKNLPSGPHLVMFKVKRKESPTKVIIDGQMGKLTYANFDEALGKIFDVLEHRRVNTVDSQRVEAE